MEMPEYKLKWLEKQLRQYNEQERRFFESYGDISAAAVDQYLKSRPDLAKEPLVMFLRQYAQDTLRSCELYSCKDQWLFDAASHDARDFAPCVTWCIDMLQAYDKWRNEQESE